MHRAHSTVERLAWLFANVRSVTFQPHEMSFAAFDKDAVCMAEACDESTGCSLGTSIYGTKGRECSEKFRGFFWTGFLFVVLGLCAMASPSTDGAQRFREMARRKGYWPTSVVAAAVAAVFCLFTGIFLVYQAFKGDYRFEVSATCRWVRNDMDREGEPCVITSLFIFGM